LPPPSSAPRDRALTPTTLLAGRFCSSAGGPAGEARQRQRSCRKRRAVGGVAIFTGELGTSIGTSAIVPEWNMAKVQRVALSNPASSHDASVTPFLTGIAKPLAIALAPDRSLLVGDWATGTIYRIGGNAS
jgi:hypothetical protein